MLIKIPAISGLVTTTVLNTKISEVENKIPDTKGLVTTIVLNAKISEVEIKIPNHDKYIATPELKRFNSRKFCSKIKTS